ncbi:hypothetical protein DENSPDRAFT_877956 [Dentipellis sp. KUC8613]|nr:hypothetical protein DENSPDRAFT_877956 [Dentipellis sp. KUC8613]
MAPATSPTSQAKDDALRLSDAALRKKKNADAQAAFRARRANYIATLEETVTNLEAVVLQLQDSCREARAEANELRQENSRLRHAGREREKFWRALYQTIKGTDSHLEDFPPLPACFGPMHPQTTAVNSHLSSYPEDGMRYGNGESAVASASYQHASSGEFSARHPSLPYNHPDPEHTHPDSRPMTSHRPPSKYGPYQTYSVQSAARDGAWPQPVTQTTSSGGESGRADSTNSSHSPTLVESPSITSADINYVSRYPVPEDQKGPPTIDNAPYVFPNSRSLSPSGSTPPSSSSTSLTSPFPFPYSDSALPQDRADFDYRRNSNGHALTLHGGIADISLASQGGDAVRYRLGPHRATTGADRPIFSPAVPQFNTNDGLHVGDPSGGDGEVLSYSRPQVRRGMSHFARSPSPGSAPMSGTLAVIKAQAFGALRRTRARTKKGADGAAKMALEALEARGIGMGVSTGTKRQRLQRDDEDDEDDDDDMQA